MKFSDVTIACEERQIQVHKTVMTWPLLLCIKKYLSKKSSVYRF